jgi:uncharacterized protein
MHSGFYQFKLFSGQSMRRSDKEITDLKEIEAIIKRNIICRIALSSDGIPCIIPLNYGYEKNVLYFHCFTDGKKIEIIKLNSNACFEISEDIEIVKSENPCDFGTRYKSVIGNGNIELVKNNEEKIIGLNIIMKQHTGKTGFEFDAMRVDKIIILKLLIKNITGKKSGY